MNNQFGFLASDNEGNWFQFICKDASEAITEFKVYQIVVWEHDNTPLDKTPYTSGIITWKCDPTTNLRQEGTGEITIFGASTSTELAEMYSKIYTLSKSIIGGKL